MRRYRSLSFASAKAASRWAIARVVLLAFVLVGANTLAAHSMPNAEMPAAAHAAQHHGCDSDAMSTAPHGHQHGLLCPCCHDGCLCLHFYGVAVPDLVSMRTPRPASDMNPIDGPRPPAPPIAENLRPPIA